MGIILLHTGIRLSLKMAPEMIKSVEQAPAPVSLDEAFWKQTQPIFDVTEDRGGTFALDGPEGIAFHTRSRVFSDAELVKSDGEASVVIR